KRRGRGGGGTGGVATLGRSGHHRRSGQPGPPGDEPLEGAVIIPFGQFRWADGVIPFEVDPGLPAAQQSAATSPRKSAGSRQVSRTPRPERRQASSGRYACSRPVWHL